jgi:hypothetical protein
MRRIRFEIPVLGAAGAETWYYDEQIANDLPLPHVGHYVAPWTARCSRRRVVSVVEPLGGSPVVVTLEPIECRHGDDDFERNAEALAKARWVWSSKPRVDGCSREADARLGDVGLDVSQAGRPLRLYIDEPDRAPTHWIGEDVDGTLWEWPAEDAGWESRHLYTRDRAQLIDVPASMAVGTAWPGLALPPEPTA